MFEFLKNNNFLNSVKNNKSFIFRNVDLPFLKWEEIINEIDYSLINNHSRREWPNYGLVLHGIYNIEIINLLLEEYSKIKPEYSATVDLYVSFSSLSGNLERHNDPSDVLYWQAIGQTYWEVEDKETKKYVLNPNDIIYIPYRMWHNVRPLSPRVGISFGLDR